MIGNIDFWLDKKHMTEFLYSFPFFPDTAFLSIYTVWIHLIWNAQVSSSYTQLKLTFYDCTHQFVSANCLSTVRAVHGKQFNLNVSLFEMKGIAVAVWDY